MPSNKINPKELLTSYLNDFSDFEKPDKVVACQLGDINLWADSKAYNFIENIRHDVYNFI